MRESRNRRAAGYALVTLSFLPQPTMSYYTPGPPGAYQYGYPAYTPGSYQYPSTAVTGYGSQWPYYYQPQQQQTQRAPVARSTPAPNRATSTSFATTQTPASYAARDTVNAAGAGAGARAAAAGSKRQANLKGLFTKERTSTDKSPLPSYFLLQQSAT
jgi:hypothetical protein